MGLTAISSGAASSASSSAGVSASVTSLLTPVGLGVGGVFVAAMLVYLLAYLDIVKTFDANVEYHKRTLLAGIIPLLIAFGSIVLYKSLTIV